MNHIVKVPGNKRKDFYTACANHFLQGPRNRTAYQRSHAELPQTKHLLNRHHALYRFLRFPQYLAGFGFQDFDSPDHIEYRCDTIIPDSKGRFHHL